MKRIIRRFRAARLAGVKEVPVIIKDYSSQEVMEIALIENIQREDLNPIEEALAYQQLIKDYRLKQDEVAEKVAKSSSGHARAIISIEDKEKQYMVAQKIFDEKLNVRDVEKLVKNIDKLDKSVEKTKPENDFVYRDFEEKLKKIMGTQVVIKNKNNNKGKIEIQYYSQAELERIYDMLKKINE